MSKRPRSKLHGIITPPQSHNRVTEQVRDDVPAQLHDADVPDAPLDPRKPEVPPMPQAPRSGRAKGKRMAEPELKDYAHRSLYAKPETLDLIREIAFRDRVSAQHLYREGLLLMLRERGHYKDRTIDDV